MEKVYIASPTEGQTVATDDYEYYYWLLLAACSMDPNQGNAVKHLNTYADAGS